MTDPIVEEVRKHREARAARFGFDIKAIFEDARKREKEGGRKVVNRSSQRGRARPEAGELGRR